MLGVILILLTLAVLVLPFLPLRWAFSFSWYNHAEEKRHKNGFYVIATLILTILAVSLMQPILWFIQWFGDLSWVKWILSFIPTHASYTVQVYTAVVVNVLFCAVSLWLCSFVKDLSGWTRPEKKKKEKKSLWTRIKEWWEKKKEERRRRREERRRRREEKKRLRRLKREQRKKKKQAGEDPNAAEEPITDEDPTQEEPQPEPEPEPEPVLTREEREVLPDELMPNAEPDNFDGKVFILGKGPDKTKPVQKKGPSRKTAEPKEEEKEPGPIKAFFLKLFSLFYVRHEDGTWYVQPQCKKVAKHLRNFLILVGIVYILLFLLLLIPIFFKVEIENWDVYPVILRLLDNSYLYPAVALVTLFEIFWFMNGRLPEEPVDDIHVVDGKHRGRVVDLNLIEQQLMQTYGKEYEIKAFSSADIDVRRHAHSEIDISSDVVLQKVLSFAQSEKLTRNDDYLSGIQALQRQQNVLFDAPLYTAVSMYLFPYLNIRISQGERLMVICQSAEEIPAVIKNMSEGFRRVQHAHACVWNICSRKDLRTDNQTDILVVTPADFLDDRFYTEIGEFSKRLTITLFPDADRVVSANNYLCVIMAQRLHEIINNNSSRFIETHQRDMQYVFLSTRHMLNLARNVTEYFLLKEPVYDVHGDNAYGDVRLYVWRALGQGRILLDNNAQTVQLETSIANIASQNGVPKIAMFTDNAIFSNQIDSSWLDTYDVYDRPIGFTVVSDDSYNLPSTIYTYSRYLCKEASVLHIISQAYMLRDYFYDDAVRSLFERPLMERGMTVHAKVNQTGLILLLCRLMQGVSEVEFVQKMYEYAHIPVPEHLTYPEIRMRVDQCLKIAFGPEASVEQYGFELQERMDENLRPVTYVRVREDGLLNRLMVDTELVTIQMNINGQPKVKTLPLFKRMLAQRYLPDQHIVVDHAKYKIHDIDYEKGIIYASAATAAHNVPDQYVQVREYTLENPAAFLESCRHYAAGNISDRFENVSGVIHEPVGINMLKSVTMVRANGSLDIDSHTVAYYGSHDPSRFSLVDKSMFSTKVDLHRHVDNAMYLRFAGDFKGSDRITMTLAVMLQEAMKTMFPEQHFCVSICPILRNPDSVYQHSDEHCRRIAQMYPKLHGWDSCEEDAIELLIVDDCDGGTGVLDMLFDAQAVYLSNILDMLCGYLDWLEEHPDGAYLNFGADTRPVLYDFTHLREVLDYFKKPYHREHDLFSQLVPDDCCTFCGQELHPDTTVLWNDRHNICDDCDNEYVPTEEETGWILDYIYTFLTRRFGVTLPAAIGVVADPKVDISELDVEGKKIRLNPNLPLTAVHMELVRQTVRLWQMDNLRITGEPEFEGQVLFVLLQYLEHLKQHTLCRRFHGRAMARSDDESVGYAHLRQALMAAAHDNSFRYMLEQYRKGLPPILKTDPKRSTRVLDPSKVSRFFGANLSGPQKEVYDLLVKGILNMEEAIDVSAYQMDYGEIREIWDSVRLDHPEFHWVNPYYFDREYASNGHTITKVKPNYWMDAAERDRRQQEIDAVVDQYLDGITDETGDFDTALQLYLNIARELDYDSIALDRQIRQNGDKAQHEDVPDDLRNIYGALVQKKAVCAGYAVAYQYLLQQLGIEAVTVRGDAGGRHAWNIIKMEGDYYHVDVTWGDGSNTDATQSRDEPSFGYFGLSDEEILQHRSIDPKPPVPTCHSNSCNYFVRNGLYFTAYDPMVVKQHLVAFLKDGTKRRVDLRFSNDQVLDVARQHLVHNGGLSEVLRTTDRKGSFTSYCQSDLHIFTAFFEPTANDGKK